MSIHFYQILNRHALLMDSEALFESGGMCLIKAITANIFNHERGSLAPDLLTAPAISAMSAAARPQQHFTTYWRGAMLPSEMVSFFSSLGLRHLSVLDAGWIFLSRANFQISRHSGDNFSRGRCSRVCFSRATALIVHIGR